MSRPSARITIGWVVGAVLTAAGVVTLIVSQLTQQSFGRFAYQPATDFAFVVGKTAMLPYPTIIGGGVLVAGLLVLAFLLGRRSATKATD